MKGVERLLLVDDDDRLRERLGRALAARGLAVRLAAGHAEAMVRAAEGPLDHAVVDLRMPGPDGLRVVQDLLARDPDLSVLVVTGYGSIATAVAAMRLGARDYLTKPCHVDQMLAALRGHPVHDPPAYAAPSLGRLEREHIERVFLDCGRNVTQTARALGIHRRTLQYKLAKDPVAR